MRNPRLVTLALLVLAVTATTTTAHAQITVLHNFAETSPDASNPQYSGIIAQGQDGNLYSTAPDDGSGTNSGVIFKITPSGTVTLLWTFGGTTYSGLTLGTDGNFYGTTLNDGTSSQGTVFQITPSGNLTVMYNFAGSDGGQPSAPPIQGTDGNFYGTTLTGPTNLGTVYKLTPSGTLTTLYSFDNKHGFFPYSPVVQGTDGNFYGTTSHGGVNNDGVVYKITPAGKLTVLYNFDGTHGYIPFAPLIQGSDGDFYGTTLEGGTSGAGVIFKITPTGQLTVLHNFDGAGDGGVPYAGLVQATDGNFYGSTSLGGDTNSCSGGCGTIFQITPQGSYSIFFYFDATRGSDAEVTLFQHTNGTPYGDTRQGGGGNLCTTANCGVFYSLNLGLKPFVSLLPYSGKVKKTIEFLGQGFTGTTAVSFNGIAATFAVISDTYLTAAVPSGATTGSVTATTPGGNLTSNKIFRVTPQITSFKPTSGKVGTPVVITGVSLTQTTAVTFGGVKATSFTVNSDTQVTATVPSGAKTGKIGITTAGGTASSSGTFTVTPAITSFSPTNGPVGTSVTIIGTSFTGATSVKFNGVSATFKVNSDTKVTATVPTGATTGPISITTRGGTAKSATNFTVT